MKLKKIFRGLLLLALSLLILSVPVGCNGLSALEKNLALSEPEFSLMTGETKMLALVNRSDKDLGEYSVAWQSENPKIATVSDTGTVVAVAPGNTKIIATVTTEKGELQFSSSVTVTQNTAPLTSLTFNGNVYTVGDGQTLNLYDEISFYPTFAATRDLVWTSSNQSIASVSNGVVVPISEGITTITVTTPDGSISASCAVRVSEVSVDPTGISFPDLAYNVPQGKTLKLTAAIEPANATGYSVLWASSDPNIATVSGGTVTALREGETEITATLTCGDKEFIALCTVYVTEAEELIVPPTEISLSPGTINIGEDEDGIFRFQLTVKPANCNIAPEWTCNQDAIAIDKETGEFEVTNAYSTSVRSVIVTCTVGELSATAVVNVQPRAPKLEIIAPDRAELYERAPDNTLKLDAAYRNKLDLPDIIWSSSDTSVATVDENGTVTGLKGGKSCTITATDKNDPTMKATYQVTVKKADYLSVEVGQTVKVDPSLIQKSDIVWTAPALFLTIEKVGNDWFITGVALKDDEPTEISGYSASTGEPYKIPVYVLKPGL